MADSIKAGLYTVGQIFAEAGFDFEKAAHSDETGGLDYRRVKVGGLPFDNLDKQVEVPVSADELVISVDGKEELRLEVELDDEQQAAREESLRVSALNEDA